MRGQTEKDRSYRNRVNRGDVVYLVRPVVFSRFVGWDAEEPYADREEMPAGTEAVVRDECNAGFRGIEATIRLADGRTATVSTGALY